MSNFLDNINTPEDLKNLSTHELEELCAETRQKIIETVSENGGHLASSLGVVELTVAMLKVFDAPKDKIIFDVGHQAYAYKILTDRKESFSTLRKKDGISGFPNRCESKYDHFSVGHASTSISAALGFAKAMEMKKEDGKIISVIGDGALSGGLAYEGLNNAGRLHRNFIVILNDNKMSISRNVGAMSRYLSYMRTAPGYLRAKGKIESMLFKLPVLGKPIYNFLFGFKRTLKNIIYGANLFENLGFSYYGPLNGHDIKEVEGVLENIKNINRPVLVHIITEKGKGYFPAEDNPGKYHGVSGFKVSTGETLHGKKSYSDVFGEEMCSLAEKDKDICAITAAMSAGTGLSEFSKKFKERFFDTGIAEEHAVTFAGALAAGGTKPVFAVYSTFLQRGFDQIIHDAALQRVNITLAIDRAGIVGDDGETHQGIFDSAFLNSIPGINVYAPSTFEELRIMLKKSLYESSGVSAVRYPRGGELYIPPDYTYSGENYSVYGKADEKAYIVTYGRLFSYAAVARESLKEKNINVSILKLNRITPIDNKCIQLLKNASSVYFFEEGILKSGIGESFAALLLESGFKGSFVNRAIDNKFIKHMTVSQALQELKLDDKGMEETILSDLKGV